MAKEWREGGYSKQAIQQSVEDILDKNWSPDFNELYILISDWIKYGKNLFVSEERKYLEQVNGASKLKNLKNIKTGVENYSFWIRRGIIILQRIKKKVTGYTIQYLVRNKKTGQTVIIDEEKMWEMLQAEHKSTTQNFLNDPSTSINNIIKDAGYAQNWAQLQTQKKEYLVIQNRINFMENFYQRKVSIQNFGTNYKTFYKKYKMRSSKNGGIYRELETNEEFGKRQKASADMPPIAEYANLNLYGRYLMYLNSKNLNKQYPVRCRKNGHYFHVLSSQIVVQTADDTMRRLYADKGVIYEGVVHSAANIRPKDDMKELELVKDGLVNYTDYVINNKVANIDNMIAEKDSIDYIKVADNYFDLNIIKKNKLKTQLTALQTKLNNGQISKNTTINLMIKLYLILKDFCTGTGMSKEWLLRNLTKFFVEQIKNSNFVEEGAEEFVRQKVNEIIKDNVKSFVDKRTE